MELLERRGGVG
ncbi:hypothetical protein AYI68_g6262, partial [Smittium mucronatum]